VVVGVELQLKEVINHHSATNAYEHYARSERGGVTSAFVALGPRADSDVVGEELDSPAFAGLFNNIIGGGSGDRDSESDRGAG
jgi:hypothetical protein